MVQQSVQTPVSQQSMNQSSVNQMAQTTVQSMTNSVPNQAIPDVMPEIPKN